MTVFVLLAALLAVIAVVWLMLPFFRASRRAASAPEQDGLVLAVLREQLAELDAELAAGHIDAEAHARSREEVERRALEEVAEHKVQAAAQVAQPERGWALALVLLVPALAIAGYLHFGAPEALNPESLHGAGETIDPAELMAMVNAFEARLQQDPDNAEGWLMLARSHMWMRDFDRAEKAFARLAELEPDSPEVFAAWADAVWAQQGKPNERTDELVGKALALDPDHLMSLQLAGTAAFQREDFIGAAAYWERALDTQQPGSEMWRDLLGIVNEARAKAGMGPHDIGELAQPAVASPLTVAGTIRIAAELLNGLDPDTTVFVFARRAEGGPPLAALRMRVADLPADFSFAGAPLMMGNQEVPAQIQLGARISLSGSATPASGDIEGNLSALVAPDASGVELTLDRRRP